MKQLDLSSDHVTLLNNLCNAALKGVGLEAYTIVKQVELWLQTAIDKPLPPLPKQE